MLNLLESAFDATMHADVDGNAEGAVKVNKSKHQEGQPSRKVQAHGPTHRIGASHVPHPHESESSHHHHSNTAREHPHGQSRAEHATMSPLSVTSSSRVGHDYAAISPTAASSHVARHEHTSSVPHLTDREWHTVIGADANTTDNANTRGTPIDSSKIAPHALAAAQPTHYYPGGSPENVVWLGHQNSKALAKGISARGDDWASARSSHPAKIVHVQPETVTPTEESWTHGALHGRFDTRAQVPPVDRGNEARSNVHPEDVMSSKPGMHAAVDHITQQARHARDRQSAGLDDIEAVEAREQAMAAEGEKHLFVIAFIPTFILCQTVKLHHNS